jgi:hypothetical protein
MPVADRGLERRAADKPDAPFVQESGAAAMTLDLETPAPITENVMKPVARRGEELVRWRNRANPIGAIAHLSQGRPVNRS